MDAILSISELTARIRASLANKFPFVWVRGEVSDYTRAASGHIYFSLKDERAQIDCVWFLAQQPRPSAVGGFDPLTGEVYETPPPDPRDFLRDGAEILCAGAVTVFEKRGRYQIQIEIVQSVGVGKLAAEFEARKARLAASGYFYAGRKRRLPPWVKRVAVIASPDGAAIRDFLKISSSRGVDAVIRLFPAPAQGVGAAEKIAAAIAEADAQNWAQVLVVTRGGGSLEDLWAYNEEIVADAVYKASVPVVVGVGHEVDFTLADLTADARAATPTHAAQLLWPDRDELWQTLDGLTAAATRATAAIVSRHDARWQRLRDGLDFLSPKRRLARDEGVLDALDGRLGRAADTLIERKSVAASRLAERAFARDLLGARFEILAEKLKWLVKNLFLVEEKAIEARGGRLDNRINAAVANYERTLVGRGAALDALTGALRVADPFAPLRRGYAILSDENGVIRSANPRLIGKMAAARLADGLLTIKIERVTRDRGKDEEEI